ncbi:MAG: hypothetical protein ACTHLW_21120 [Verrucomicrobiota bacterium]
MAKASLATLWVPDIWIQGLAERQATFPALFNSGAVKTTDLLNEIASGPGKTANIPFLKDITDQANEVQVESTAPVTVNGAPGDKNIFPILNRVTKNAFTAMASNVSGADVVGHCVGSMSERRLKQYQTTLIAMLRGMFGTGSQAANAAAPLSAVRLGGTTAEPFTEDGDNADPDANLFTGEMFIDATVLMGELADSLKGGALLMHPVIKGRLQKLDKLNFRTLKVESELPYELTFYRDCPIFVSSALVRAGATTGYVYDTYLLAQGTVGFGQKPQVADQADLASVSYFFDRDINDDLIWDRTRTAFGVDGVAFTGAPAGSSATDAELGTVGNWTLKYSSANRVGAVAIRTNG